MNASLLLGYFGGIVLMVLISILVIFNFVRYRFKGDLTFFFIALFAAGFIIISLGSLLLTKSEVTARERQQLEETFR